MEKQNYYQSPPIIAEVGKLLREALPTGGEDAEVHILELDALRYPLAEAVTNTMRMLYEKRKQLLWPKDKDVTELDRSIRLNADMAPIERDFALLQKLEVLLKDRIELCIFFLG